MRYGLIETFDELVTVVGDTPLDLTETKLAIRSHTSADDSLVSSWITASGEDFQEETGRQLITARRYFWLECFPLARKIELPRPPLQEVEAVEYYNSDGTLVSFGDGASPEVPSWIYTASPTDPHGRRGFVELKDGFNWPATQVRALAVRIQYLCGYGNAHTDIPDLIKSVLRAKVSDRNRLRGGITETQPYAVESQSRVIQAFKYSALPSLVPRRYL